IGILAIPVSVGIRRRLEETLTHPAKKARTEPIGRLLAEQWQPLVASVLLMIGLASAIHVVVFYLPNYAVLQVHIPLSKTVWAGFAASLILAILSPFAGWLSDRIGRRKVVLGSRLALLVVIYPAFVLLNGEASVERLLLVTALLAVPMTLTGAS